MERTVLDPKVKKNFGFGCMRLPMQGKEVDLTEFTKMVNAFLAAGFNYFDTAHGYLEGKSETAIKACLTSRYPREEYVLTDKLSNNYFNKEEDIRPFFESQLQACGVEYFDFYLMHAQDRNNFEKYKRCRAYETAFALKAEGKVCRVGLSFHDKAEVLERILSTYPEVDAVQIQFNYVDYEDASVESRKCYEVCRKFGKPVIVMEPVKGGSLVNLPTGAKQILESLGGGSPASYAIRFAAGFEGIAMVLSGMGNMQGGSFPGSVPSQASSGTGYSHSSDPAFPYRWGRCSSPAPTGRRGLQTAPFLPHRQAFRRPFCGCPW